LGYTYDGKMVRIYWNGVLISEEEKGWNTVPGMAEIGRRVGANSFKGAIDEVSVYNKALTEDEIRRDCRRNDPTGTTCPDPKSPIILMPTLNLPLPPTKALFAWRSEKDPVGKLMYPDLNYDVRFDRDDNNNGIFTDANFDRMNMEPLSEPKKNSLGSWYYVEERNPAVITTSRGYRLRICPSGTGCAISNDTDPQRATRTFSTLGSGSASWWSFDEASGAAVDSIGTINGQLVNELGRTTGINGSALSLDDWNDYVNLSDAPDLRFDNGSSFMIEGWVRRNSIDSSTDETIFSKMDMTYPSGTGYYFAIHSGGNIGNDRVPDTLDFIMRQQNSNTQLMIEVGTEATIADTNWHHVAVSYTGSVLVKASSIRLYMDGQPQRVITFKDDTLGSVNTLAEARIGASRRWCDYRFEDCSGVATSYDNVFNGLIDEVMVVQDDLNPSNLSPAVICNSYLTTCLAAGLSCDFSCVPQ
ncbi:MAG: LamG domain-containing protein, partial [Deltaproteobacteria bacterium]|nr:LamG domain-containing protein [Deltaproteobacteria bacterium]